MSAKTPVVDAMFKRHVLSNCSSAEMEREHRHQEQAVELLDIARALEAHCEAMANAKSNNGMLIAQESYEFWRRIQLSQ